MTYVKSFREPEVYKYSREVSKEIFIISKTFPPEEKFSLTDQVRRSSRSLGAQISEAWGKRRYEKSFVSKLTDADYEQLETQHWIEISLECGYINSDTFHPLILKYESIGKMLYSMIDKSEKFCKHISSNE
jgi:four helix bundle protein